MKGITLNENSWHYKLYSATYYNYNKIENFCPYFWKTIFALLMLPLTWSTYLWIRTPNNNPLPIRIVISMATYLILGLLSYSISLYNLQEWLHIVGVPILFVILGLALLLLIVFIIFKIDDKMKQSDTMNFISTGVDSFMNKYCPKITWVKKSK